MGIIFIIILLLLLVFCIGIIWIFDLEKLLPLIIGLYAFVCLVVCLTYIMMMKGLM